MDGAGPSGFRNVDPMSRQERAAARDKDLLEKARLQARNRGGPLSQPENFAGNPVVPARNAPAFCDEYDRFNRDVAGEMNAKKQQNLQKKEEVYAVKRAEQYHRERSNWETQAQAAAREAARLEASRTTGTGAKRNQGSESYNIISLNYNSGSGGQQLAAKDTAIKEARQARAVNLYSKSHSVSHNIITGEPIKFPTSGKE
ncbi:hypothetical protein HXX76_007087 [Chlamydomonas incerta]|uniref:Flagellar associated protein n=1 Tax=Chlamydomonas incerta TaxID=51695 RepID=A0A835SYY6_CHLIN|nr:hypothetical protein HXX76_007087 [Chlamydomonas incerta]|eukprot:KAG2435892.1 hypothetical protein HXX76_007087 [Chlamydomonas incerta]